MINYKKVNKEIRFLFDKTRYLLDVDSIEAINHYLDHDEYEMAFEGLVIDLIKLNNVPDNLDKELIIRLAEILNLKCEPNFDPEIWDKLNVWVNNSTLSG